MKYVSLGRTGLKVSRICLGMMTYGSPQWRPWVLDAAAARPFVQRALELGVNFFDTADMYSNGMSETITGTLLKEFARREEVVIATKVFFPVFEQMHLDHHTASRDQLRPNRHGLSRKHILHAVDASLQRLGTDYIDLYQIHRWDYRTPIEETMEALHDVVKAGKVRYLGASSMWARQFAQAQQVAKEHGWTPFVSMQNHYNLVYREEEREMIPLCQEQGVALIPWSPLARGFLAGNRALGDKTGVAGAPADAATTRAGSDEMALKYYYNEADFAVVAALTKVAQAKNISNAQAAYAWLLHKGVTAPIVGASKLMQLEQAVAASDISLSEQEISALENAYQAHAVIGHS